MYKTGSPSGSIVSATCTRTRLFCFFTLTPCTQLGEKLKRRLNDSEKSKASSASSEKLDAGPVPPKCPPSKSRTRQQVTKSTAVAKRHRTHLLPIEKAASYDYAADLGDRDEIFTQECTPQTCVSPIPIVSYPPLSPCDPHRQSPQGQSQAYYTAATTYDGMVSVAEYDDSVFTAVPFSPPVPGREWTPYSPFSFPGIYEYNMQNPG